jgi:hypothetical protein
MSFYESIHSVDLVDSLDFLKLPAILNLHSPLVTNTTDDDESRITLKSCFRYSIKHS